MFSYSSGSVCLEVPHLTCLVTGCCEHLRTILWYRSFIEELIACIKITDILLVLYLKINPFKVVGEGRARKRLTTCQQQSRTGAAWLCSALASLCPFSCTSQQRTCSHLTRHTSRERDRSDSRCCPKTRLSDSWLWERMTLY